MITSIADTTTSPWSAVVRVISRFADGSAVSGSGVVVGPNDVLTASHVVEDVRLGRATSVQILPGLTPTERPFGSSVAHAVDFLPIDRDGDNFLSTLDVANDVAILGLSQRIDVITGRFLIGPEYYAGPGTHATGYPSRFGGSQQIDSTGTAAVQSQGLVATSDLQISAGNSGGPVWVETPNGPAVVGIVSTASYAFDVGGDRYPLIRAWILGNDHLIGGTPAGSEPPPPTADTGGTLGTARALGGVVTNRVWQESAGRGSDSGDRFIFTSERTGTATITLSGLGADIDLYILRADNTVQGSSVNPDGRFDEVQLPVTAGEALTVLVSPWSVSASRYTLTVGVQAHTASAADPFAADSVFRFSHMVTGATVLTASGEERAAILNQLPDLRYEGSAFRGAPAGSADAREVFRFREITTGDYLYTINSAERDVVATQANFVFDGVAFRAFAQDLGPQQPVYRLFEPATSDHLYTTSVEERAALLVGSPTIQDEGIAFWVLL